MQALQADGHIVKPMQSEQPLKSHQVHHIASYFLYTVAKLTKLVIFNGNRDRS